MCSPVNAMSAIQLASSLYSSRQQAKAGSQQASFIAEAASKNYEAISARGRQTRSQIKQQIGQRASQAQKELGRINAVLSDSNLVGNSSDRLRSEVLFSRDADVTTLQENAFQASEQTNREFDAARTDTRSQLAGISRPSTFEAGMNLAASNMTNKGPSVGDLWDKTRSYFPTSGPELLNR